MGKIIKVFPRVTNLTPVDENSYYGPPTLFAEADQIHISVTFTWDLKYAEELAYMWESIAPVQIGGPATNKPSGEFVPGMYIKKGCTITSRGCPNKCWFCSVWKREPKLIELKIHPGNNVLDDNLLACSDQHIKKVFTMLSSQKAINFSGGLEAELLKPWHVDYFLNLSIDQMFFAYDTKDDWDPLVSAAKLLTPHYSIRKLRCYVLIGFETDTCNKAISRLVNTFKLGFMPMAMLITYKNRKNIVEWKKLHRLWARPMLTKRTVKEYL